MSDPRATAEVLVLAHQVHSKPVRVPSSSASPPGAATAERGRALPPYRSPLGVPLDDHQLRRLDRLGPLFEGWGREAEGPFFVDVDSRRYRGALLHEAIGAALRATGGSQ